MTTPETVPVTDEDRIAYFAFNHLPSKYREAILAGEWDDVAGMQIIARHRLAAVREMEAEVEQLRKDAQAIGAAVSREALDYANELMEIAGMLAQQPDGPVRWKQYRLAAIADFLATLPTQFSAEAVREACAMVAHDLHEKYYRMDEPESRRYNMGRQEFIAATFRQFGQVRRQDIMREFDISLAQAANDIAAFLAAEPPHVKYDVSAKAYVMEGPVDDMEERPFAYCCAEAGGHVDACDCVNKKHGTAFYKRNGR